MSNKSMLFGLICSLLVSPLFFSQAAAQGVLVPSAAHHHPDWHWPRPIPRPTPAPTTYSIKELSIDARVEGQIARTSVTQSFSNNGRRPIEAQFVFPLPYDGAVDQMTFLVNGKEIPGKLMPADEARKIYQNYVRRYKDPALLQWVGHGMFQTNVFPIPAGESRTVMLKYTQLLRKNQQLTDYLFPLSTAKYTSKPIEKFAFRATIQSKRKIKNVYSPTHDVSIERPDENSAVVKLEKSKYIPSADLRLLFDHHESAIGTSVVSYWPEDDGEDGYFMLMASPDIQATDQQPAKKTVIFVVDRSGSMNGKKIEQARGAAKFVLNNLRKGDLFNVIAYDSDIETFKPELQRYNEETAAAARAFIEGVNAGGSTNIDSALTTALDMIQDDSQPNYMLFLTDGLPTAGEQNEAKIVNNAEKHNEHTTRIISFGVGYDVNSRLLDRLTRANRGQSHYVRPDENLEKHVSQLYDKISAPILTDLEISYQFENASQIEPVNRVYPQEALDIFAGQQLVLVGRYERGGPATVKLSGKVGQEKQSFTYDTQFATAESSNDQFSFVAKLWAVRRIGEIIDLIDLEGRNEELVNELVRLSTEHGIVTQYTAFLADPNAKAGDLARTDRLHALADSSLDQLEQTTGQSGFGQRQAKQRFKSAQRALTPNISGSSGGRDLGGSGGGGFGGEAGGLPEQTVRQVGKHTLYKRGKVLVASNARDVDLEKERDQVSEIQRFSDKYFELIENSSKSEKKLFAEQGDDEELLVRIQGDVYLIK